MFIVLVITNSNPISSCFYFEILFLGTHSLEAAARLKHELEKSEAPVPVFVNTTNTTVVTSVGQTVYLYCGVQNLGDRAVSFNDKNTN